MKKHAAIFSICFSLLSFNLIAQSKPDALKLYNAGNYREAIKVCEAEIASSPKNRDSYVVLCWSLIANKQYAEAETRATAARKFAQYDQRIIEVLAEAKYFLGQNDAALALFSEYISLVSTNGNRLGAAYYYSGEIFILQGKYEHADIALTQAVKIEPLNENWWVRLGYAREMTQDYKQAALAYQTALSLNPSTDDALRGKERVMPLIR